MQKLNFTTESTDNCSKAVVFIHGWRGNKNSFSSLPSMLKIENTAWFFPEAPYVLEDNKDLRSWSYQKEDGSYEVEKSRILLEAFLSNNLLNKYLPENIYFIGFSQGATVCYEFILSLEHAWGGVFPVAGFFRDWNKGISLHSNQKKTKICIGHGISDKIIDVSESEKIHDFLSKNGCDSSLIKYNGGHKISLDYLKHIKQYIK